MGHYTLCLLGMGLSWGECFGFGLVGVRDKGKGNKGKRGT